MQTRDDASLLFDPARLAQARRLRGMLKSDLASDVHVTPGAVSQYESGTAKPSPATLARIAFALQMPHGFFARGRPSFALAEDEANFRSLRATTKRERSQVRAHVELLAELVDLLERHVRLPAVDIPVDLAGSDPEEAAIAVRSRWALGVGPIANMVGVMERRGVIVARLPAEGERVDAFSCWFEARPYVILATNKQAADRSRFDAAHELGHLVLHHDPQPGPSTAEVEAHAFASAFLMPRLAIAAELPRRIDFASLIDLKRRWGVSIQAMVRRGRALGIYSDAGYHRAMRQMGSRGWRTNEPGDIGPPEQPELMQQATDMVLVRYGEGLKALADRTQLPTNVVTKLLSMFEADVPAVSLT